MSGIIIKNKYKISVRKTIAFCIFLGINYKLISDSMLYEFMEPISGKVLSFVGVMILLCTNIMKRKRPGTTEDNDFFYIDFLLMALTIIVLLRIDTFWLQDLCMLAALIVIFKSDFDIFQSFVYASLIAILPFLLRWMLAMIRIGKYLGNRGPIHFTTIMLLLASLMYMKNVRWIWQYIFISIAAVIDFIGQSRTYLVVCGIAFLILTYYNFREKFTVKKLVLIFGGIIVATVGIIILQDKFIKLFTNKWAGQTTIFTGRSMIWIDVLSEFRWIGYEEDYILKKFLLSNAHNSFIQAYVAYGAVVAAGYILLIIKMIIKCIKYRDNLILQGLTISFIPVTVGAFFESNFILDSEYLYLGICNAFLIGQIAGVSKTAANNTVEMEHVKG